MPPQEVDQRTHRDPRSLHVENEHADAFVLGSVRVGPRAEPAVVGVVGIAAPYLLAVDHPAVAVVHGAGLERRQVRARVGLAVAEAEDRLTPPHLSGVLRLLLLAPEQHQGLPRPVDGYLNLDAYRCPVVVQLLGEDEPLDVAHLQTAVLPRIRRRQPALPRQLALELAGKRPGLLGLLPQPGIQLNPSRRYLLLQPLPDLRPECLLLRRALL